ncbi:MAG: hypothetical protein MJE66_12650 [Proteobacteria bacterium]|nr:hypothetical protein [Pseudomonadota bacterium]
MVNRKRSARRIAVATVLATAFALAPMAASAEGTTGQQFVQGGGAALCSLVYGPAKMIYALGGSLIGGLAWVFSGGDDASAKPIWDASLRGDYVITPAMLRGEGGPEFIGRSQHHEDVRNVAEGPPSEGSGDIGF